MITVKQFLDNGFELVAGDTLLTKRTNRVIPVTKINVTGLNCPNAEVDEDLFIKSLVWRKNTGVQPVTNNCWLEVEQYNDITLSGMASQFLWMNSNCEYGCDIKNWKPSLEDLEQQMNGKLETKSALEMSERDIENYEADCKTKCESTVVDDIPDSEELLNIGNVIHNIACKYQNYENHAENLASIVTKLWDIAFDIQLIENAEKIASEREAAVNEMLNCAGYITKVEDYRANRLSGDMEVLVNSLFDLYDAGYRKMVN